MLKSCGICCSIFSIFAIIFLSVVSSILSSGSDIIEIDDSIRQDAASNCMYAAGVYCGFIVLSIFCYIIGRYNEYRDIRKQEENIRLLRSKNKFNTNIYQPL